MAIPVPNTNKKPNLETIGGRLKYIRLGIGMTREEFAKLIKIKQRRLVMIELNERRIGEADIEAICKALARAGARRNTYGTKTYKISLLPCTALTPNQEKRAIFL